MNPTLVKSLLAFLPVSMLLAGSLSLVLRSKSLSALLQLLGAAFLTIVALTHVCEALGLFPVMQWGQQYSAGHYLDFCSAILGFTLFPLGYLFHSLRTIETVNKIYSG